MSLRWTRRRAHPARRLRSAGRTRVPGPGFVALLLIAALGASGCSDDAPPAETPPRDTARPPAATPTPPAPATADRDALAERGRRVYQQNCIACHAPDPTREGGLGPAVAGSSRALLEARVVHGTYPDGYVPKRDTRLMIPLKHLAPEIDALHAYLEREAARAGSS